LLRKTVFKWLKATQQLIAKRLLKTLNPTIESKNFFPVVESKKFFKILNPAVKDKS